MGCGQEGGAAFPATPGQVRRSRWPPRGRDPFPLWAAVHTPHAHWVLSLPGGLGKPYRGLWELFLLGFPRTWGPPSASLTPPVYPGFHCMLTGQPGCGNLPASASQTQDLPRRRSPWGSEPEKARAAGFTCHPGMEPQSFLQRLQAGQCTLGSGSGPSPLCPWPWAGHTAPRGPAAPGPHAISDALSLKGQPKKPAADFPS